MFSKPRPRAFGCLLWLLVLVVVLIVLSVLFGGFQKGTRVNGEPPVRMTVHATESIALLGVKE
jgi:hypothetical protein